jgi:hypothetical protein
MCTNTASKVLPTRGFVGSWTKKGSSFAWQSRGHIWRVGLGTQINIWEDHWIPSSDTRRVYTQKGQRILRSMANLIDPFTGQWDEDLVRDTFITVDVERILMVPLSEHVTDDFDAC